MQGLAVLKEIRVQIMMDEELLKKVEDFRSATRIPSKSEAIRTLIIKGMKADATEEKQGEPSE